MKKREMVLWVDRKRRRRFCGERPVVRERPPNLAPGTAFMIRLYEHPFSPYAAKVKISLREKGVV